MLMWGGEGVVFPVPSPRAAVRLVKDEGPSAKSELLGPTAAGAPAGICAGIWAVDRWPMLKGTDRLPCGLGASTPAPSSGMYSAGELCGLNPKAASSEFAPSAPRIMGVGCCAGCGKPQVLRCAWTACCSGCSAMKGWAPTSKLPTEAGPEWTAGALFLSSDVGARAEEREGEETWPDDPVVVGPDELPGSQHPLPHRITWELDAWDAAWELSQVAASAVCAGSISNSTKTCVCVWGGGGQIVLVWLCVCVCARRAREGSACSCREQVSCFGG